MAKRTKKSERETLHQLHTAAAILAPVEQPKFQRVMDAARSEAMELADISPVQRGSGTPPVEQPKSAAPGESAMDFKRRMDDFWKQPHG